MIKNFKTADFLLIKAEFLSLDENETVFFHGKWYTKKDCQWSQGVEDAQYKLAKEDKKKLWKR